MYIGNMYTHKYNECNAVTVSAIKEYILNSVVESLRHLAVVFVSASHQTNLTPGPFL